MYNKIIHKFRYIVNDISREGVKQTNLNKSAIRKEKILNNGGIRNI